MSPSEDKGIALGLRLLKFERHRRSTATPNGIEVTKVFAQFESPPLDDGGDRARQRRQYLNAYAKSRAGAWRVAVRWLRQLQKGKI